MTPHDLPKRAQPSLGDLLDLARQMQADRDASASTLRHRDRRLGQDLTSLRDRPASQLLGWLDRLRPDSQELHGERVDVLHRVGLVILGVAGLLVGWGATAVVFRYDGTHPVNVIHVLAVFVVLQLLALVLFTVGLLPPAVTRFLPGMRTVQDALRLISPGRLQHWLARSLPQRYRDHATLLVGKGLAHGRLYGRVDRWVIAHSSQVFAVAFNVGALASALYLVTFSDLAFAWSTTLETDSAALQRWTDLLSSPWAALVDGARPSFDLIEATRYFRLKEGTFPAATSPEGLGGWWPFLVLCMVVYGLLPRLVTWLLARGRLRAALRQTVLHYPGASDLLARLNTELVETRSDEPVRDRMDDGMLPPGVADVPDVAGQPAAVINWSAAVDESTARAWVAGMSTLAIDAWHEAGGARTPAEDREVVAAVAATADAAVLVLVKAWEPPMAEVLDFLAALRRASRPDRALLVAPLGESTPATPAPPPADQLDVWRRAVARASDPWLRVLPLGGDDA
jgi:hypothetical protein